MRKDLLAVTALGSASFLTAWSGAAIAGPNFDWAGPYIGASVGLNALGSPTTLDFPSAGSEDIQFDINPAPFRTSFGSYGTLPTSVMPYAPLIGTVSAGFNHQSGSIVFGLEADASFSGPSKYTFTGNGGAEELTVTGGVETLFTLRPRVGVAVDRLLLFGTGGLAFGEAKFDTGLHLGDIGKGIASADWSGSNSAWKTGFTLGAARSTP
jgi:outer membrane immunogenic protein